MRMDGIEVHFVAGAGRMIGALLEAGGVGDLLVSYLFAGHWRREGVDDEGLGLTACRGVGVEVSH